eukprot:scaffold1169_cov245-Pinguiococcus_pyrenoidosus.AAC.9
MSVELRSSGGNEEGRYSALLLRGIVRVDEHFCLANRASRALASCFLCTGGLLRLFSLVRGLHILLLLRRRLANLVKVLLQRFLGTIRLHVLREEAVGNGRSQLLLIEAEGRHIAIARADEQEPSVGRPARIRQVRVVEALPRRQLQQAPRRNRLRFINAYLSRYDGVGVCSVVDEDAVGGEDRKHTSVTQVAPRPRGRLRQNVSAAGFLPGGSFPLSRRQAVEAKHLGTDSHGNARTIVANEAGSRGVLPVTARNDVRRKLRIVSRSLSVHACRHHQGRTTHIHPQKGKEKKGDQINDGLRLFHVGGANQRDTYPSGVQSTLRKNDGRVSSAKSAVFGSFGAACAF